ncbi:Tannase/feruloyl esterase [Penicillium italicum]|uniref:Carboxylic ester hydrolase n=1 Tax=Penicillium italicum TaxID=40296 RepID=A0A0A2L0W1_PENIT|nr:Tannase/feruloyl esterase [Penicillium italicum]
MGFAHICLVAVTALSAVHARSVSKPSAACHGLLSTDLSPGHTVTDAALFPSGSLNSSGIINSFTLCRVQGTVSYNKKDTPVLKGPNTLTWELYLPITSEYNDRFIVVGNGGYAGNIDEVSMMTQLNLGYAVAGCDSGHPLADNGNSTYAPFLANKGEVKAWIHNSIAMVTDITRTLTTEYYNKCPEFSYYHGCSTGGAQGYALAQFHPELFDGIYAGSPGNWYSHLILSFLWNALKTQGSGFMNQDVLDFITDRVVSSCDSLDGVVDGLIENPLLCDYDITQLQCPPDHSSTAASGAVVCLTSDQVEAVQAIYAGPRNTVTGEEVYPGMNLGSESGWLYQETALYKSYSSLILKELVFDDLDYNISNFNWGSDVSRVDKTASPLIDEISPDLSSFRNRGGKLITTQGWADQFNAALWPIQHLQQIQAAMGGADVADFVEVFMVPGGGHCGANPAYSHVPGKYQVLDVLVPWVEQGIRPAEMLSTTPPDGSNTTRKLCPWPENARYTQGDINDWTSYTCI